MLIINLNEVNLLHPLVFKRYHIERKTLVGIIIIEKFTMFLICTSFIGLRVEIFGIT